MFILNKVQSGKATIKIDPADLYGLDQFQLSESVIFNKVINSETNIPHFRIAKCHWSLYYEICTYESFQKYFEITEVSYETDY